MRKVAGERIWHCGLCSMVSACISVTDSSEILDMELKLWWGSCRSLGQSKTTPGKGHWMTPEHCISFLCLFLQRRRKMRRKKKRGRGHSVTCGCWEVLGWTCSRPFLWWWCGISLRAFLCNNFNSFTIVPLFIFAWVYIPIINGLQRRKCGLVDGTSRAGSELESICLHRGNLFSMTEYKCWWRKQSAPAALHGSTVLEKCTVWSQRQVGSQLLSRYMLLVSSKCDSSIKAAKSQWKAEMNLGLAKKYGKKVITHFPIWLGRSE